MAKWLRRHLPDEFAVVASPARRAQQTAAALETAIETEPGLAPGASVGAIFEAALRREERGLVIVVGHQPDLGRAAAHLVAERADEWSIAKGAVVWIDGRRLRAVLSPDLL
jgi:phosphohistidine phosphatase